MPLYCSYLGPFVELENPIYLESSKESGYCDNKDCSNHGFALSITDSYCSKCGSKIKKRTVVGKIFPSIKELSRFSYEFCNYKILELEISSVKFDKTIKKYYFVVDNNMFRSGTHYQITETLILNQETISSKENFFREKYLLIEDILKKNFEKVSSIQFGWIKYESYEV